MKASLEKLPGILLLVLFAVACGTQWVSGTDYVKVPAYGAGYQPQELKSNQQQTQLLAQILETLLRIEQRLETKTTGTPTATDAVGLLAGRCMKCHSAEKPEGELVLVEKDGTLALLSVEQRRTIKRRLDAGSMPPPKVGTLSPQEKTALLNLIGPKLSPETKE
jgi:hypothetical protein